MRIVFIGLSNLTEKTVRSLIEKNHEIIVIESDKQKIDAASDHLDCGFLLGDGSRPDLLKEVGPEHTDILFCMTSNDQTNIIASLVGRSLGFRKVITKIDNIEFEHICSELGLENIIIPTRTISLFLVDMVAGRDIIELSTMIKGNARFFSFFASREDEGDVSGLNLPENARAIFFYRGDDFLFADRESRIKEGDEVVVLTHSENLEDLKERWSKRISNEQDNDRESHPEK